MDGRVPVLNIDLRKDASVVDTKGEKLCASNVVHTRLGFRYNLK
jgi:hypothetical protein